MIFRFAVLIAALGTSAFAQLALSTIRGTVSDPTGAVIAKAQVEITDVETNTQRSTTTNADGDFEVPDLRPSTYRLVATAPGFKSFLAENIILEGNQVRRLNVAMEIGATTTQVAVTAGAAVISTDSSKLQSTISGSRYADVPWVGAEATLDPSLIITTAPLVNQTNGVWSSQWAGQNSRQVQEGQDGHTNDNAVNQLNDILDVDEVTIVAVNNTAEFARVGYMNMVTKSGSNQFHGRALYWHQNSALGARDFFETNKAKTLIHTSSLGISGPIVRDKLFFYASANILKVPSKQFYLQSVPTDRMRSGDFSQLLTTASPVTIRDPLTGAPFLGNIIPAGRINPLAQKVNSKYLPAPNRGGADSLATTSISFFRFPRITRCGRILRNVWITT